jgi:hypothetical protein
VFSLCKPAKPFFPEWKMNNLVTLMLPAAILVSSNAFAQSLTCGEVREQPVEAQQNRLQLVTEASYPAVATI